MKRKQFERLWAGPDIRFAGERKDLLAAVGGHHMARTARRSNGVVWGAAGAAIAVSVAALAQNAVANVQASELAVIAKPVSAEAVARHARQQAVPASNCGGGLARFLKELTSPPSPFGSDCNWQEDW